MCGRYTIAVPRSELMTTFELFESDEFEPRYNMAPRQMAPVIRQRPTGERVAYLLRWGLVPSWAKDDSIGNKLINARAETVAEKASFRSAYKARRCLIPASGFYEWKTEKGAKQPYLIYPATQKLFGFAGLWERWTTPAGDPLETFTIITTAANAAMKPLHDRMPVILQPHEYELWLTKDTDPALIHELLQPSDSSFLAMHPVSKAVGNVRNEGPSLTEPI